MGQTEGRPHLPGRQSSRRTSARVSRWRSVQHRGIHLKRPAQSHAPSNDRTEQSYSLQEIVGLCTEAEVDGIPRDGHGGRLCLAVGETVILLHPPLPVVGVSMGIQKGVSSRWQSRRRLGRASTALRLNVDMPAGARSSTCGRSGVSTAVRTLIRVYVWPCRWGHERARGCNLRQLPVPRFAASAVCEGALVAACVVAVVWVLCGRVGRSAGDSMWTIMMDDDDDDDDDDDGR